MTFSYQNVTNEAFAIIKTTLSFYAWDDAKNCTFDLFPGWPEVASYAHQSVRRRQGLGPIRCCFFLRNPFTGGKKTYPPRTQQQLCSAGFGCLLIRCAKKAFLSQLIAFGSGLRFFCGGNSMCVRLSPQFVTQDSQDLCTFFLPSKRERSSNQSD